MMSVDKTIYMLVLGFVASVLFAVGAWVYTQSNDDATPDPYDTYVENMPERPADWTAEWPLSREDAHLRATLGCGQEWVPGTIDAVLAEAYEPDC